MTTSSPQQQFQDLMLEVVAVRWAQEPRDRLRRGPAIAAILESDLSEVVQEHLQWEVGYFRSFWERNVQDLTHPTTAWEGWEEEMQGWFNHFEPLQARMTLVEVREMTKRFEGVGHCVGMDIIHRKQSPGGSL